MNVNSISLLKIMNSTLIIISIIFISILSGSSVLESLEDDRASYNEIASTLSTIASDFFLVDEISSEQLFRETIDNYRSRNLIAGAEILDHQLVPMTSSDTNYNDSDTTKIPIQQSYEGYDHIDPVGSTEEKGVIGFVYIYRSNEHLKFTILSIVFSTFALCAFLCFLSYRISILIDRYFTLPIKELCTSLADATYINNRSDIKSSLPPFYGSFLSSVNESINQRNLQFDELKQRRSDLVVALSSYRGEIDSSKQVILSVLNLIKTNLENGKMLSDTSINEHLVDIIAFAKNPAKSLSFAPSPMHINEFKTFVLDTVNETKGILDFSIPSKISCKIDNGYLLVDDNRTKDFLRGLISCFQTAFKQNPKLMFLFGKPQNNIINITIILSPQSNNFDSSTHNQFRSTLKELGHLSQLIGAEVHSSNRHSTDHAVTASIPIEYSMSENSFFISESKDITNIGTLLQQPLSDGDVIYLRSKGYSILKIDVDASKLPHLDIVFVDGNIGDSPINQVLELIHNDMLIVPYLICLTSPEHSLITSNYFDRSVDVKDFSPQTIINVHKDLTQ